MRLPTHLGKKIGNLLCIGFYSKGGKKKHDCSVLWLFRCLGEVESLGVESLREFREFQRVFTMRLKRMEGRETLSFVNWPSFFFSKK